jgi:two-component system chemotaxis sensor kinase CheA
MHQSDAELASKTPEEVIKAAVGRRSTDKPGATGPVGRRDTEKQRDNSIRVDTARLDQVLNLSGEIGLTKNRLNALRSDILNGRSDTETLHALDLAVSQLDLLVSDLQNAVMKTRMQPIGRLFQKYPRIARDLARNLGKDVELVLSGEDTEIDKTMIEDLSDPIIHLIRNAVDHGVEETQERLANGKPEKSIVRLEARQEGDHIVILVADDGRGMNAERCAPRRSRRASSPTRRPTPWTSARATTWCSCPASRWPARSPTCPAAASAWTWCAPTSRSSTAPSTSAPAWARAPPSSSACR